jgi:hypothetical protein
MAVTVTSFPRPARLAYQPPASNTFLSQQTSHQQPASSTFLSEQISISHQPPAKRTSCRYLVTQRLRAEQFRFGRSVVSGESLTA